MWKEGSIKVNSSIFHYWMKQFDEGSEWGIEGGRISKLTIRIDDVTTANYDRGWDKKPTNDATWKALQVLLHEYS